MRVPPARAASRALVLVLVLAPVLGLSALALAAEAEADAEAEAEAEAAAGEARHGGSACQEEAAQRREEARPEAGRCPSLLQAGVRHQREIFSASGADAPDPEPTARRGGWRGEGGRLYRKAFVINRLVDEDRLRQFNDSAQRAGVQFERFDAVDKDTLDLDSLVRDGEITQGVADRIRAAGEADLSHLRGSYASTLSHNGLWEKLAAEGDNASDPFLVFEDDAVIPPDFHDKLSRALEVVPDDWDFLYLNHNILVGQEVPPHRVWLSPDHAYAGVGKNALTSAYMVRPAGLQRMLSFQRPVSYTYTTDDNMRRHFADFNAYFLIDKLVPTEGSSVRLAD